MRCLSVSAMKGERRSPPLQKLPGEGTKLRKFYDILQANKGKPFDYNIRREFGGYSANFMSQLQDFYGLDIRVKRLGRGVDHAEYLLAGEWFGRVYVDYVAERMNLE